MCASTAPRAEDVAPARARARTRSAVHARRDGRPEEAHATVGRESALHGAVRQHDQLVHAGRERAQLVDRRPERRARRVDLLRDDDEPHAARASTARSTSSTTLSAYSSGVYAHADRARPPSAPRRSASVAVGEDPDERVRDLAGPVGVDEQAGLPVPDHVGDPPGSSADDGPPAAERLEHDLGRPLGPRGEQEQPRIVECLHDVRCLEPPVPGDPAGELADERLHDAPVSPVSDDPQRGLRDAGGGEPPRVCDRMDVLVSLEHADEQRGRALRERRDRRLGERGELGVGRERERRLDPGLADDPCRERRKRPHGVRPRMATSAARSASGATTARARDP